MVTSRMRKALAFALGLAATAASTAEEWVVRYECTLAGGTRRVFSQDISEEFLLGVGACRKTAVPASGAPRRFDPADLGRPSSLPPEPVRVSLRPTRAAGGSPALPPAHYAAWIDRVSGQHGVDPALTTAVMYVESRFRADARSPKGALGLMQVMPATAADYGVATAASLLDPRVNIDVGVRHLRGLIDRFGGRLDLALAAYNAGEGAVRRHGLRIPPFAETQDYVAQVLSHLRTYKRSQ